MNITKELNGNTAIIRLEGWLDAQSSPDFQAALDALEPESQSLCWICKHSNTFPQQDCA